MSYIQVELDAFKRAGPVAGRCGVPLPSIVGGLACLWHWCWSEKETHASEDIILGCFACDSPSLIRALIAAGFLEPAEGAFRVRGAERYLRIAEAKSDAGKASARGRERDAKGRLKPSSRPAAVQQPSSTPLTANQLLQRSSDLAKEEEEDVRAQAPGAPAKPERAPAQPSAQQAFFAWTQDELEKADPLRVAEKAPEPKVLNSQLKPALTAVGRKGLELAWRHFERDAGARERGYPWGLFVAQWQRHHNGALASDGVPKPVPPPRKSAPVPDFFERPNRKVS